MYPALNLGGSCVAPASVGYATTITNVFNNTVGSVAMALAENMPTTSLLKQVQRVACDIDFYYGVICDNIFASCFILFRFSFPAIKSPRHRHKHPPATGVNRRDRRVLAEPASIAESLT